MISVVVVDPDGVILRANGRNERLAVRGHRDTFLRGWAKGQLLGLSVWKALPPDM